jgi:hypothetical protein
VPGPVLGAKAPEDSKSHLKHKGRHSLDRQVARLEKGWEEALVIHWQRKLTICHDWMGPPHYWGIRVTEF